MATAIPVITGNAVIPVPTLSTQGWVTDLSGKLDMLLSHFFLSDFNQTQLYPGMVTSLPEIIQRCGGQATQARDLIQKALTAYFTRYYPSVQVDVSPTTDQDTDPSLSVELLIQIAINDGDQVGTFARLVKSKDSKLSEIMKLNNG